MNITAAVTVQRLMPDFDGHAYHGHIHLFGADHHVRLIRVKEGHLVEPHDDAHPQVKEWFDDMQRTWEGAYQTVAVPGLPGRYVLTVFPFAE